MKRESDMTATTRRNNILTSTLLLALGGVTLLSGPAAFAQSSGSKSFAAPAVLKEMDHHMLYTWKITPTFVTGATPAQIEITRASITFTQMYNWDNGSNKLHLHLLDTAINSGVKGFFDDDPNVGTRVDDLTDDFISTRYHNGKDARNQNSPWIVAAGTKDTLLASESFGNSSNKRNYTYTFAGATLNTLNEYFRTGGDFAFGLDADCHYYNTGVTFNVGYNYDPNGIGINNGVPEPSAYVASLAFGLPLIGLVVRNRRRQRTGK